MPGIPATQEAEVGGLWSSQKHMTLSVKQTRNQKDGAYLKCLLSNRNSLTSILILPKDKTKTKTKQARNPLRLCSTPKEVGMGD
jgi:hypothetical protein